MAKVPTIKLNDGTTIPKIGYGLGTTNYASDCTSQIQSALTTGYDYIDCAEVYNNTQYFGPALKGWLSETGSKREAVYVLEKCGSGQPAGKDKPREALVKLLEQAKLDYVDMYLLHSPLFFSNLSETWATMEALQAEGLTKSIGVSNFREEDLQLLQKTWKVVPAVNQIEYHPYNFHPANMQRLRAICDEHDIKFQCYGPLSSIVRFPGGPVDAVVKKIAENKGAEDSQILLAWAAQKSGGVVVTTSRNLERQKIQLEAITKLSPLTEGEIDQISKAGEKEYHRAFMVPVWDSAKP